MCYNKTLKYYTKIGRIEDPEQTWQQAERTRAGHGFLDASTSSWPARLVLGSYARDFVRMLCDGRILYEGMMLYGGTMLRQGMMLHERDDSAREDDAARRGDATRGDDAA